MTAPRFMELTLYALLRILPFLFLMLYVFRGHMRFPKAVTGIGIVLLVLLRVGCGIYTYFNEARMSQPNPGIWIYIAFCLLLIKAHPGKSLFTLLMLNNISAFTVVAAKCLEGIFFPNTAAQVHRWSDSLMLVVVELAVLIPIFLYIKRIYAPALAQGTNRRAWRFLWCIPLTIYIVWYRNIFYGAEGFIALAMRPSYTFYCLLLNLGGMMIYSLVVMLIREQAKNIALREREHALSMQHAQYHYMQDRIEEARRAKHDMRKHVHVMKAYLDDKRYDELDTYLSRYSATIPEQDKISFCDNYAVNALMQYFYNYAKIINVPFSVSGTLPCEVGIPDEVLTVVIGNLLENAIEACLRQGDGCVISARCAMDETAVLFKIINTCREEPRTDEKGQYLSSKRDGECGVGLGAVADIAKQYNGICKAHWEDGSFIVSVMLMKPQK